MREIGQWLACFSGRDLHPQAGLGKHIGTLWIRDYPLPDKYAPEDRFDLFVDITGFPETSPRGIYLKETDANHALLAKLRQKFNVFENGAVFHEAKSAPGYAWICFGYLHGWQYNIRHPNRSDNLWKMFMNFWRVLGD
ncbi:MAG: hypothetical protein LBT71_03510 [Azoarcus sp.]|nr:hypothetical protein [Azoarcus sp.]